MGTDQLSLTKCLITVTAGVNVRDWHAVLKELREHFDPYYDFILIPKVPLDTLDFTSYEMNLGSKMIIDATKKTGRDAAYRPTVENPETQEVRSTDQDEALTSYFRHLKSIDRHILDMNLVDETLLLVKVSRDGRAVVEKLVRHPKLHGLRIVAAVSEDVDIHSKESYIWGVFTRFDCERDVIFTEQKLVGISPIYRGVMGIDATWKSGYPEPLVMKEEVVRRVDEKWGKIWK